jgi:hypothetical protein
MQQRKYCYAVIVKNEISSSEYYGRYPSQAAKKAFRNLLCLLEKNGKKLDKLMFEIINLETKKIYQYVGVREKVVDMEDRLFEFYNKRTGKTKRFLINYTHSVHRYNENVMQSLGIE